MKQKSEPSNPRPVVPNFTSTYISADARKYQKDILTDHEVFNHLCGCPFFKRRHGTENTMDKKIEVLYPLFRKYHLLSMDKRPTFKNSFRWFQNRLIEQGVLDATLYKSYERLFINFLQVFRKDSGIKVVLPYYPYRFHNIVGCAEVILKNPVGIHICDYDLSSYGIDGENMNHNGFRLQLAGRAFHTETGIEPATLSCIYLASKTITYFTYLPQEKIEGVTPNKEGMFRHYGIYCSDCEQRNCRPLIDNEEKYGWRKSHVS